MRGAEKNYSVQLFRFRALDLEKLICGLFSTAGAHYQGKIVRPNFLQLESCFTLRNLFWTRNFSLFLAFSQYYKRLLYYKTRSQALFYFRYYRFVLFSGLGYKRRLSKTHRILFMYIANRHWLGYRLQQNSLIVPVRRRNFIFFASAKAGLTKTYDFFSSLRKPYIYKTKGFLDTRVRAKFLFVRRLRIRGLKLKLSKKQKML